MDDKIFKPIAEPEHEDNKPQEKTPAAEEVLPEEVVGTKKVKEKKPRKKKRFFRPIVFIIVLLFCIFAVADIVDQQNQITQLEQETQTMRAKIDESKQQNDEYLAMLSADEDEFMERVAVEQLGYAYPNERRFFIISGNED